MPATCDTRPQCRFRGGSALGSPHGSELGQSLCCSRMMGLLMNVLNYELAQI